MLALGGREHWTLLRALLPKALPAPAITLSSGWGRHRGPSKTWRAWGETAAPDDSGHHLNQKNSS